jgi:flagellar biosynthetic protein FliP
MSPPSASASSPSAWLFIRHYLEMVAAMLLGMVILGLPIVGLLALFGASLGEAEESAPAAYLLVMAATMTAPMVAWMRHRGHGWMPCLEMAAAMFVPAFAAVALLASGALTDFHALMMIEHIAMFPLMLLVMLLRRREYALPHAVVTLRGSSYAA